MEPVMPAPTAERQYIADLELNARFSGTFSIANAQLGVTKNGDHYLACLLGDKTGNAPARRWNMSEEAFRELPTDGFVRAEGRTQPFKGELQLIVERIEPATPTDEDLAELLPSSARPATEMFDELATLLGTVEHPALKALIELYLEDEQLMSRFRQAPAAKQMHHAYIGGLLEHTLQLCHLADRVCPLYPKVNRDVVIVGLFLHDLGKTRELAWDGAFSYTDRGELVGHIVEGAIMLHDKAQQLMVEKGTRLPKHALSVQIGRAHV
jgi:3'-5' exoribonuclease